MKPVIYLRIASALMLLHAVLHTIGGVFGKPQPGPQQAAVTAMKLNQFPLMGAIRSFWGFYRGFGLGITIFLMALAVVLWQLSSLARRITSPYGHLLDARGGISPDGGKFVCLLLSAASDCRTPDRDLPDRSDLYFESASALTRAGMQAIYPREDEVFSPFFPGIGRARRFPFRAGGGSGSSCALVRRRTKHHLESLGSRT